MQRWAIATAAMIFTALTMSFAQDIKGDPPSAQVLGPQLIAWSQFQKPQPVPQPLPPPDKDAQSQTQGQNAAAQAHLPADQQQEPAAQTFTGTIVKDGKDYILKVNGSTVYQLDDQDRAKQYEGKQVKIAGKLDAKGNSLHITSIELVS